MELSNVKHQRILISPLDWGMGHVSRCIGLVRILLQQQNTVIIACDAKQQAAFQSYFPDLKYLDHAGYNLKFSGRGKWRTDLLKNLFRLWKKLRTESRQVKNWVQIHNIDLVISDHRYGFYADAVPSILLIHQLHLPVQKQEWLAQRWHVSRLKKFRTRWVPDDAQQSLSGKLGAPLKGFDCHYIGPISRFEIPEVVPEIRYDFLFVISGPAPYAELFFRELVSAVPPGAHVACICPEAYSLPENLSQKPEIFISQDWKTLDSLFLESSCIVSRAGYSTLMDLKILDKKGVLIPTPGQAEQLYLAEKHQNSVNWEFRPRWNQHQ